MRFAGTAISSFAGVPGMEAFLDPNRPNAGEQSMAADNLRARESVAGTELMGRTTAQGIAAAGEVEGARIEALGQQALASAEGNAAMFNALGSVASGALGSIPTGGGLPPVGTPARGAADMKTLNNMTQPEWNNMFSGWSEGLNFAP